jgi:hypothetical protein
MDAAAALSEWGPRRRWAAVGGAILVALSIGIPTDVIPNPVFGRPLVDVTWWAYPQLAVTAALGGLLIATYVAEPNDRPVDRHISETDEIDAPGRVGGVGGLLSFLAVGCPTCNKLVVLAVGTSGALDWFAPAQPLLALVSIGLLGWAVRVRLRDQVSCPIAAGSQHEVNIGG